MVVEKQNSEKQDEGAEEKNESSKIKEEDSDISIGKDDDVNDIERLSKKIVNLRILEDVKGKMNLNILQSGGEILCVPQFTLYADTRKGNRPGFEMSAAPSTASEYWEKFNARLTQYGVKVKKGIFAADMEVELVNDGPVTIWLDSKEEKD